MAANSSCRGVTTFGKRVVTQILTHSPTRSLSAAPASSRRSLHASVYDKNVEDHVRPALVPDDMIHPHSDKYWSPNPSTGVFGPATDQNAAAERGFHTSPSKAGYESVLEQKTFFRPLEDLEKPQHP
ncbi:hypothetical protein SOVF_142650 [Spinacia oleracea]|uniref:Late embryogenesis abundant protein At5g17165 n=1 Tax=Spinacia oleracea TaxID=3562 RepID=A0A9R0J0S4_SPIOL|nr:late embryogenesis abundant protein At5g17165-like [Spinacia oleracea]KNA10621.1 hypothetical protein SOVF_142650 [Spinacia oleracea]